MKILKFCLLGMALLTAPAYGEGFGTGPFSLEFGNRHSNWMPKAEQPLILDEVICNAISNQKQIVVTVETKKISDPKEMSVTVKEVIIEPYAFGNSKDGKPVLRGNVVSDKTIKEVTVKYSEDKFVEHEEESEETAEAAKPPEKKGFFSGLFSSSSGDKVDISSVRKVTMVSGSHFDVPKDFKGFEDDSIHVICELPVAK